MYGSTVIGCGSAEDIPGTMATGPVPAEAVPGNVVTGIIQTGDITGIAATGDRSRREYNKCGYELTSGILYIYRSPGKPKAEGSIFWGKS